MADAATTDTKIAPTPDAPAASKPASAPVVTASPATVESAKAEPAKVAAPKAEPAKASAPVAATPASAAPTPAKASVKAPIKAAAPAPAAIKAKPVKAQPVKAPLVKAKPVKAKPVTAKQARAKAVPAPATSAPVAVSTAARATKSVSLPLTKTAAPKAAPTQKKETIMDTMKTTTEKAKTLLAEANERAKTAVEKTQKMAGDMTDFSKGNVEAIVESSKIAAKGMETMGQDAVAYAKQSFEEATAAAKQMASIKNPADFMKMQSDFFRSSFDAMVAHTSKSTEAMLKLAGEVAQPISNRVSLAVEKVKIAA